MKKTNLKTYAAMVNDGEKIKNNSMKLYSYLLCIAGKEPQGNGRLFQHKNLVLTEIKRCTGLEPKTVKLYLYDLELQGLVRFRGDREFSFNYINQDDFIKGGTNIDKKGFREAKQKEVFNKWKLRPKNSYYYIPRPDTFTPIPEITLHKLNSIFELTEFELKLYIICCSFRDLQVACFNGKTKKLKFEEIKDILDLKDNSSNLNKKIKKTLYLLKGMGLIEFELGYYINSRGAKIDCVNLTEVNYYVKYEEIEWKEDEDIEITEEIRERLEQFDESCFNSV